MKILHIAISKKIYLEPKYHWFDSCYQTALLILEVQHFHDLSESSNFCTMLKYYHSHEVAKKHVIEINKPKIGQSLETKLITQNLSILNLKKMSSRFQGS